MLMGCMLKGVDLSVMPSLHVGFNDQLEPSRQSLLFVLRCRFSVQHCLKANEGWCPILHGGQNFNLKLNSPFSNPARAFVYNITEYAPLGQRFPI